MANTIDPTKGSVPASAAATSAGMKAELEDRSKFIRTMAKDMAALSGTAPAAPTQKKALPAEQKKEETFSGVTTEKAEQPFFERLRPKSEDRAQEAMALPSMQEASSIVGKTAQELPAEPTSTREADRATILERLRQKVGDSAQLSIQKSAAPSETEVPASVVPEARPEIAAPAPIAPQTPAPEPLPRPEPSPAPEPAVLPERKPVEPQPVSAWQSIPSPSPEFAPLSEPIPSRLPPIAKETYREPIDAYVPPRPIAAQGPDPLHTYTTDFADRIDAKGSSAFSVLAAEQDSRATAPSALKVRRKGVPRAVVMVATGIVLVVLAGGGSFAAYQFVMTMRDTPIASLTVPSIVFADEYRELEGGGSILLAALANSANGALVPGNVLVAYVLSSSSAEGAGLAAGPAGGDAFMRALQLPIPDILLRNIAGESTVGVINAGGQTKPFFALRVDSYERTYAGMLTWEPLISRDLGALYPLYPAEAAVLPVTATTTATSTTSSTTPATTPAIQASALTRFEDAIVANHDVRILRDTDGRSLILYGYADKRTLLIVRDEAAFEALLARLKAE